MVRDWTQEVGLNYNLFFRQGWNEREEEIRKGQSIEETKIMQEER